MMRNLAPVRRAALVLSTLALLSASGTTGTTSTDTDDNTGGMLKVSALSEVTGRYEASGRQDVSPKPLVEGTRLVLEIMDDEIRLHAGCNTLTGRAEVVDHTLVVTETGATEMGCEKKWMDQDAWLASYLTQRPTIEHSGPNLALTWKDGWLGLTRTGDIPAAGSSRDGDAPVSDMTGSSSGPRSDPSRQGGTDPLAPGSSPS